MRIIWLLVLLLGVQGFARAEDGNPYLVKELFVESKVFDPIYSRKNALKQATEEGFYRLLGQLTSASSIESHKEELSKINLDILLKKVHIVTERNDVPYQVTFDLEYDRTAVKDVLTDLKIPFSEISTGRVLLIPLYETEQQTYLWQDNNPWKEQLIKASKQLGLVHFILPTGDVSEMRMLTPEMAAFGAEDILLSVAQGYATETVCVVRARESNTVVGRQLSVEANWYGKDQMEPMYKERTLSGTDNITEIRAEMAASMLKEMEDKWRSLNMLNFDQTTSVLVRYVPVNLSDAQRMRQVFEKLPILKDLWMRMMSQSELVYQIDFYGDVPKLLQQVEALGIHLKQAEDGAQVWVAEFKE